MSDSKTIKEINRQEFNNIEEKRVAILESDEYKKWIKEMDKKHGVKCTGAMYGDIGMVCINCGNKEVKLGNPSICDKCGSTLIYM